MKVLSVCPECGVPGVEVPVEAVRYHMRGRRQVLTRKVPFMSCCSSKCKVAYYSEAAIIKTHELTVKLWYKDAHGDVPICYCSKITRAEIGKAMRSGAKKISDVQKLLQKDRTGFCEQENPLGKCCRDVFLHAMNAARKTRGTKSKRVPHDCGGRPSTHLV